MTNYSHSRNEYLSNSGISMYQRNINGTPAIAQSIHPTMRTNVSISQVLQMNEFRFFHYTRNDCNFYLITCQIILENSIFSDEHDYDHGFFYQYSNDLATNHYYIIKCKLYSHPSIVNILNREIYGIDLDVNKFKRNESMSLNQKLNLEQVLPSFFMQSHTIPKRKMRTLRFS